MGASLCKCGALQRPMHLVVELIGYSQWILCKQEDCVNELWSWAQSKDVSKKIMCEYVGQFEMFYVTLSEGFANVFDREISCFGGMRLPRRGFGDFVNSRHHRRCDFQNLFDKCDVKSYEILHCLIRW